MADGEAKGDSRGLSTKSAPWLVAAAAILAAGALVVARLIGGVGHAPSGPTMEAAGLSAHCAQFIQLAKARYGTDWKYRLDPRDSICAQPVEKEWVRQWSSREAQAQAAPEAIVSTIAAPPPSTEPALEPVPDPLTMRRRNPETYCLNVISLARAKFGSDWKSKVTPQEAASCKDEIAKIQGR